MFSGGFGVFGAAFFIFEVMQHEPVGPNYLEPGAVPVQAVRPARGKGEAGLLKAALVFRRAALWLSWRSR